MGWLCRTVFVYGLPLAVILLAITVLWIQQRTVWWAGYDILNCPNCQPVVDWSNEKMAAPLLSSESIEQFRNDGVVVLPNLLDVSKVAQLADEADRIPNTFMTDVLCRLLLRFYRKYEHRVDTRSSLIRDWAVHSPLGSWAAQLLHAKQVRLYNAEIIYHAGEDAPMPCEVRWHRDSIAAPFAHVVPSVTFNVYLNDIDGNSDGLIYQKGSHKNVRHPPSSADHDDRDTEIIMEPQIEVGDLLAHDPNIYRTTSGRGCWKRRSLQFRYVAGSYDAVDGDDDDDDDDDQEDHHVTVTTRFAFNNHRFPHGPTPWTLAHATELAPHGLQDGVDALAGPWYPQVYPHPLPEEHTAVVGVDGVGAPRGRRNVAWTISNLLDVAGQATQHTHRVFRGGANDDDNDDNDHHHHHHHHHHVAKEEEGEAIDASPTPTTPLFWALDGLVENISDWALVESPPGSGVQVPMHKRGPSYRIATAAKKP